MKKRIAILHASNTLNYGTMMMVTNFIKYYNDIQTEEVDFYIDNDEEDGLQRTIDSIGNQNIYRLSDLGIYDINMTNARKSNFLIKALAYFNYAFSFGNKLKKANIDSVVILGGDDLSEGYGLKGILYQFAKLRSITKKNIQVVLLGQTIGPFYSWRKALARKVFSKNVFIFTRDEITKKHLENDIKVKVEGSSKDLALLDLPLQDSSKTIIVPFENYITIVVSGLYTYTKDKELYVSKWVEIINKLVLERKYNVVLLAHVLNTECNDADFIKAAYSRLDKKALENVHTITDKIMPYQARQVLGSGRFTITGRMHAAISTFQMSKPALSHSYSVKYKGVIGGLGREDLVIEAVGDNYWKEKVVTETMEKVDYIESNYDSLCAEINTSINSAKKEVRILIEDVNKILN